MTFHEPKVAQAAGGKVKSPVGAVLDRYIYYPGTEALGKEEIRIIACGTGTPAARRGAAYSFHILRDREDAETGEPPRTREHLGGFVIACDRELIPRRLAISISTRSISTESVSTRRSTSS